MHSKRKKRFLLGNLAILCDQFSRKLAIFRPISFFGNQTKMDQKLRVLRVFPVLRVSPKIASFRRPGRCTGLYRKPQLALGDFTPDGKAQSSRLKMIFESLCRSRKPATALSIWILKIGSNPTRMLAATGRRPAAALSILDFENWLQSCKNAECMTP